LNPFQTRPMVLRISVVSYQRQDEEPLGVSPGLLCQTVNVAGKEALVVYVYIGIGKHFYCVYTRKKTYQLPHSVTTINCL